MGINGLIYASSSSVYGKGSISPFKETEYCGEPESLYAATKRSNELMAHSYFKTKKLSSIGLRFFTVYGPFGRPDMMPMLIAKAITTDKPIEVFNNGNQHRDFTYVDDICKGVLSCFDYVSCNDNFNPLILNIGNGNPTNLLDFIDKLEERMQKKVKRLYKPSQLGDVTETYSSNDKIHELLGFEPEVNIEKGLDLFVDWYKNYYSTI
jgi:UDP-glucuronate 4-epimerase